MYRVALATLTWIARAMVALPVLPILLLLADATWVAFTFDSKARASLDSFVSGNIGATYEILAEGEHQPPYFVSDATTAWKIRLAGRPHHLKTFRRLDGTPPPMPGCPPDPWTLDQIEAQYGKEDRDAANGFSEFFYGWQRLGEGTICRSHGCSIIVRTDGEIAYVFMDAT
jgi:hypothetical protein